MTEQEFEDKVEEWHTEDWDSLNEIELHEYLGVTWEQYCKFVKGDFDE